MGKKRNRVICAVLCLLMAVTIVCGCITSVAANNSINNSEIAFADIGSDDAAGVAREGDIAGVGNHNSYSSGGSSSHSSSSSSSSSSRHSSSSSSSSSGGGGSFGSLVVVLILLAVVGAAKKKGWTVEKLLKSLGVDTSSSEGSKSSGTRVDVEAEIRKHDENFSEAKFIAWSKQVFIKLNEAWSTKDWRVIRPFESEELFEEHNAQLNEYICNKTTNHLERVAVKDAWIDDYSKDDKYEYLTVVMHTQMIDYIEEDETGKITAGDKTTLWQMVHSLKFMRTIDAKTELNDDGSLNTTSCPNCGAPTQVTSAGECEYCHTVITKGNYGWVLVQFTGENI